MRFLAFACMIAADELQYTCNPCGCREAANVKPYYLLFFMSGFPALLYQIVWQRALFTIYGVNIQSVTVIVTVFMLGLGLGSLAGGKLSAAPGIRCLRAFGLIESSVGLFGVGSLPLFHRVAQFTAGQSIAVTGVTTFLLLLVPTLLMGSTLPLLVAYFVRRTANVGDSVGSLYARSVLWAYRINGRPVFDPANSHDRATLEAIVSAPYVNREYNDAVNMILESRVNLLAQWSGQRLITDDNMGTEWQ